MAAHVVDEAVRNAVAAGADPDRIALLDNFCWPDPVQDPVKTPDGEYKLAQLVRAARGLHDTAVAYGAPFISGKDSMKNDYKVADHKVSVLPTILVSAIGIVPDVSCCVTPDFKQPGDQVYLLGATGPEMGESLLYRTYGGSSGRLPEPDPEAHLVLYRRYHGLTRDKLLASGHDLSEGGLAVALAECCIGSGAGAHIDIAPLVDSGLGAVEALFSEGSGRFLVSVEPDNETRFLEAVRELPHFRLGSVDRTGVLRVQQGEGLLFSAAAAELAESYRKPLFDILGMVKEEPV
jgi:phosphoribosylformylglycinamidine synthase